MSSFSISHQKYVSWKDNLLCNCLASFFSFSFFFKCLFKYLLAFSVFIIFFHGISVVSFIFIYFFFKPCHMAYESLGP